MNQTGKGQRILMLTSHHDAQDGRIYHLEAKTLQKAGFSVAIVAPGHTPLSWENNGVRFYTFTKKPSGFQRKWSTLSALIDYAEKIPADFLHVHEVDAPLMAAAWVKFRCRRKRSQPKIIFDSHEVWQYFYAAKVRNPWLRASIKHGVVAYEEWMISRFVDGIITAHELEEHYYRLLNPWIPVRKVLGAPPLDLWGKPPERSGPIRVIGHDGYFSLRRGMATILAAFETVAFDYSNVSLLAAGDFHFPEDREYFQRWENRTGLTNRVVCTGWVDRSEIQHHLDKMDIGLIANKPDIHSIRCFPANKLMYYLGRALPVISTPAPLYKRFIEAERCGLVMTDFSPQSLERRLRWMIEHPTPTREMGWRGYQIAQREFHPNQAKEQLLLLYKSLC